MSVALPLGPSICITNEELTLQADEYQRQLVDSHRQCSAVTVYIWYPWCQTHKDETTLPRDSHIPLLNHCRHLLWNIPTRHKKSMIYQRFKFIICTILSPSIYSLCTLPTFTAALAEAVFSVLVPPGWSFEWGNLFGDVGLKLGYKRQLALHVSNLIWFHKTCIWFQNSNAIQFLNFMIPGKQRYPYRNPHA